MRGWWKATEGIRFIVLTWAFSVGGLIAMAVIAK